MLPLTEPSNPAFRFSDVLTRSGLAGGSTITNGVADESSVMPKPRANVPPATTSSDGSTSNAIGPNSLVTGSLGANVSLTVWLIVMPTTSALSLVPALPS